jgi:hypothetical protein
MKAWKVVALAVIGLLLVFVLLIFVVDRMVLSPSASTFTAAPAPRT